MNTRVFLGRNLQREGPLTWSDGVVTLRETPNEYMGQVSVSNTEVQLTITKKNRDLNNLERELLGVTQTLHTFLGEVHSQGALCLSVPRWWATPRIIEHWWKDDEDLVDNIEDYLKLVFDRSGSADEALACLRSLLSSYTKALNSDEELVVAIEGRNLQVYPKSLEHQRKNIELNRGMSGWSAVLHQQQGGFHTNCIEAEASSSPAALLALADEYRRRFS
jgi:hypothetical protein